MLSKDQQDRLTRVGPGTPMARLFREYWIPAARSAALVADLKARHPRLRLYLSTTTMAGQQLARRSVRDVDAVFYFPFDFGFVIRRTLDLVRPELFIMMETEIWPNLLRACRKSGVKTMLVNGRISSRSYPRYTMARGFFRRVLDGLPEALARLPPPRK